MADDRPIVSTGAKDFGAVDNNRGVVVGDASGYTRVIGSQTNNYLYAERPETPPSPSCTIPFRRDPDFVDRGALLDQIHESCSAPAARVALVGLGGVGKSQLAIEHCYRTVDRSPETWVFWAHASNAARLEQSYRDIADHVKLRGRDDPQANVFKLVHDWLRNEKNGKWLLVLDNADDAAVLSLQNNGQKPQVDGGDCAQQRLSEYLPPSKHSSVLVTSRTRSAASQLVEESDIILIKPMDEADAQALLQKKLGDEVNKEGIVELATTLEYMPLALVQAAAYIQQRAPRCSVYQYLENFRRSDLEKDSLLNYEAGRLRRDREAKNSIVLTWQISFDHVRQVRPSAADLLSLMSLFDRQGIPQSLLDRQYTQTDKYKRAVDKSKRPKSILSKFLRRHRPPASVQTRINHRESSSREHVTLSFEDDILTLRNYSFVTANADGATFEMHALVQLATRKWLQVNGHLERWKQQYIKNLNMVFPEGKYENWIVCQALFPHAKSAEAHKPTTESSLQEWASILYKAAWYALETGRYGEAERMSKEAVRVNKRLLGQKDVTTLHCIAMLASTYWNQGRWNEAEELDLHVMDMRKRVLGAEHPNTLLCMANLASTYWKQGRWNEAEELYLQAIEITKRVLGAEHPNTLTGMAGLASTYWKQGRWNEAEELYLQAIEIMKRVLGAEHPDTLTSMAGLASTYWNQGRWDGAEELYLQVVEIRKRVLGAEHLDTLISMAGLASTYWNQGRWDEAEELYLQVIEAMKRVVGAEHPDTLTSMRNLVFIWRYQGRRNDAFALSKEYSRLQQQVLDSEHPSTVLSLKYLDEWQAEEESGGRRGDGINPRRM